MKRILFIVLFSFLVVNISAQVTTAGVMGRVTDASKEPLVGGEHCGGS